MYKNPKRIKLFLKRKQILKKNLKIPQNSYTYFTFFKSKSKIYCSLNLAKKVFSDKSNSFVCSGKR